MNKPPFHFDAAELSGLNIQPSDHASKKFLMLVEGQYSNPKQAAQKYGYSESYYYEVLRAFKAQGFQGLINKKRGPKQKSIRTEPVKNWVIRYKFLDDKQSATVITQKLRQHGKKISERSIQRIIEEYGLQKKPL